MSAELPIKLLIVAAAGGLGSAITRQAVSAGYAVSVLVRSEEGLAERLKSAEAAAGITKVFVGDASDPTVLSGVLQKGGFDVVGVAVGAQSRAVVENAIAQVAAADPQPALVMTGGSPALAMEDGSSAVTGAFGGAEWAQSLRDMHVGTTFAALQASTVKRYCMVCPGTMKESEDGKPHGIHSFRPNIIDASVAMEAATYDDVATGFLAAAVDLAGGGAVYNKGKVAFTAPANAGGDSQCALD